MRRLLHIVFLILSAMVVIVAQTPAADAPASLTASDTVAAPDSVNAADSVPTTDSVSAAGSMRPNRGRRINPVNTEATRTQHHNDAMGDSLRAVERRRQRSTHYHDENGNLVMVDTVTGEEWIDSLMLPAPPKMKQPLLYAAEIGVNIWDPLMRAFGQKYGGIDFSAALNLHNRYIPTFEAGFGMADKTPASMNFTYKTPLTPYFKIGLDYNFIYNSDPAYRFFAGVRYGFSAFRYSLRNVTFDDSYWGETGGIDFPSQNVTAGWFDLLVGLRVNIVGPVSAGWMFRYHSILHQSHPSTGDAWYIPGYGSSGSSITGSFYIVYNIDLARKKKSTAADELEKTHE